MSATTTPEFWRKLLEINLEIAVQILKKEKGITTQFVIHTRGNEIMPVLAPFKNDQERAIIYDFMKVLCAAKDAVALAVLSEAWVTTFQRNTATHTTSEGTKTEAVVVYLVYYDDAGEKRSMTAMAEIERDGGGDPTGVKSPQILDEEGLGPVHDILPDEPPTALEIKEAEAMTSKFFHKVN